MISVILHFFTFIFVVSAGIAGNSGLFFWAGAAIFTGLLVYQHLIVKHDDLSRVNLAFGTTNGIASLIFTFFTITDLIIRYK